tara:strand:- start:339 stop:584 length:246 start_codon:yes stop_codon:yes gene_type:complete
LINSSVLNIILVPPFEVAAAQEVHGVVYGPPLASQIIDRILTIVLSPEDNPGRFTTFYGWHHVFPREVLKVFFIAMQSSQP